MRIRHSSDQQLPGIPRLAKSAAAQRDGAVTRRAVVTALAAGAVIAPRWIAPARAAEPLAVRLDWSPHAGQCAFHLAMERGWFQKAGLDVQMEDGNGSTTTVQIVGGGRFDIGHAALAPMAIGRGAGLPVIAVAGFMRKGDMGILVDQKIKATKLEDLEGKKIDFTAGSLEGPFVEPFFNLNHIPLDKISLLNVDASAKLSSYVSGQVDGIITSVPTYYVMLKTRRPVDPLLFADYGLNLPGFGIITRPETLKTKGDAVKRFVSVVCSSWTYIFDGHEEEAALALMAQRPNSGMSKQELVDSLVVYRPFFFSEATKNTPIGIQDTGDWSATLRQMENAKVIPDGTKPSDYFTNDYIDYALGNKIIGTA